MAKKKTETLQVGDSTPVFESSVITKEEFTKTIDNLYLTKLDSKTFEEVLETISNTSNEHYKNELQLQLCMAKLRYDFTFNKVTVERTRLFSLYLSNLPWYKRLFRCNLLDCYNRALADANSALGSELEEAQKTLEDYGAALDNFLTKLKFPDGKKRFDSEDLPEELREQTEGEKDLTFEEVTL